MKIPLGIGLFFNLFYIFINFFFCVSISEANFSDFETQPPIVGGVRFLAPQEIFEYRSRSNGGFRYNFQHSIWQEIEIQEQSDQGRPRERVTKTVTSPFSSWMDISRRKDGDVSLLYSFIETEENYPFEVHLNLRAQFVDGSWTSIAHQQSYTLRLTANSQICFDHYMAERLEYILFRRLLQNVRPNLRRSEIWLSSLLFSRPSPLENPSATHYWVEHSQENSPVGSASRRELVLSTHAPASTYFFGDSSGLVVAYPNYEVDFRLQLTHLPDREMSWQIPADYFRWIEPLVGVESWR